MQTDFVRLLNHINRQVNIPAFKVANGIYNSVLYKAAITLYCKDFYFFSVNVKAISDCFERCFASIIISYIEPGT